MRRALRRSLPAFSRFYGLKPWEVVGGTVECLTFGEIEEYQRQYADYQKQIKEAGKRKR